MSDPPAIVPSDSTLEDYIDRHRLDLTEREKQHLRDHAPRDVSGLPPDDAYYDTLVEAFRELRRRRAARESGTAS
jgi:hypothetical protein